MRVYNLPNASGIKSANQFEIVSRPENSLTDHVITFQSYQTKVATIDKELAIIYVDPNAFNFSKTTARYTNIFFKRNSLILDVKTLKAALENDPDGFEVRQTGSENQKAYLVIFKNLN